MDSPHLARPPKPSGGRISKLFIRGKVVSLGEDEQGSVLIWVQALTRTQHEEAALAAALVGTRRRLIYKPGFEDYDLLIDQMEREATDLDLIDGIIAAKHSSQLWVDAELDLHADPAWRDNGRLDLIRHSDDQLQSGAPISNDESEALVDLNTEYMNDWRRHAAARLAVKQAELGEKTRAELEKEYIDAAVSVRALTDQSREYNVVATFYALRPCSATLTDDGQYTHAACSEHKTPYFSDVADVRQAPDEIIDAVVAALSDLDSAADVLGGSEPQAASA